MKHKMTNMRYGTLSFSRIGYIDALKGFAILCVVLGHITNGYLNAGIYPEARVLLRNIYNLIYAFHMPMFMMLSGYVYYVVYFDDSGEPDRKRISHQIYNQIGVYGIFSVVLGLFKVFTSATVNNEVTLIDIALIGIKSISPYWYLYVLIFLYLIFSVKWLSKLNKWMLLGIFTVLAICGQLVNISWFEVSRMLYYSLFFFIGIAYKEYKNWIIGNRFLSFILFCASIGLCVLFWSEKYIKDLLAVNIIVALGISLALWYMFEHIGFLGNCRFLKMLGRHCLEIYVIHCFFTAGLRVVFPRVGVNNVYMSIFLNLVISTAIPVLFSMFCCKLSIHGLFFKPFTYFYISGAGRSKI